MGRMHVDVGLSYHPGRSSSATTMMSACPWSRLYSRPRRLCGYPPAPGPTIREDLAAVVSELTGGLGAGCHRRRGLGGGNPFGASWLAAAGY